VHVLGRLVKNQALEACEEVDEGPQLHAVDGFELPEAMIPVFAFARDWFKTWLGREVGLEHSPAHPDMKCLPQCFTWDCIYEEYQSAVLKVVESYDLVGCVMCRGVRCSCKMGDMQVDGQDMLLTYERFLEMRSKWFANIEVYQAVPANTLCLFGNPHYCTFVLDCHTRRSIEVLSMPDVQGPGHCQSREQVCAEGAIRGEERASC
jgi:hypothetical protein